MRLLSLSFKVAAKIGNHTSRVVPSRPDLTRQRWAGAAGEEEAEKPKNSAEAEGEGLSTTTLFWIATIRSPPNSGN
jgi:hypothetical protein